MKKKEYAVPVQKGRIDPNPMTMKQETHSERLKERARELKMTRDGQTMKLHTPRKGRK